MQTGSRSRQRPRGPSTNFLARLLAIAETSVRITETARSMTNASATIITEPGCRRFYLGPARQQLTLWPDLRAVVTSSHYDDHYLIEIDHDTENSVRVLTVCRHYATYYTSEAEQRVCGIFPLVLWVMPNATRC